MLHDMIVVGGHLRAGCSTLSRRPAPGRASSTTSLRPHPPRHVASSYVGRASRCRRRTSLPHRSHGEILAKCYSAMQSMDEGASFLRHWAKRGFLAARPLSPRRKRSASPRTRRTTNFILRKLCGDLSPSQAGFSTAACGRTIFFLPFGSYPNNAIGGSARSRTARPCSLHTASPASSSPTSVTPPLACGPVWEALNFSRVDGSVPPLWRERRTVATRRSCLSTSSTTSTAGRSDSARPTRPRGRGPQPRGHARRC